MVVFGVMAIVSLAAGVLLEYVFSPLQLDSSVH